jgi:hypothetical protein
VGAEFAPVAGAEVGADSPSPPPPHPASAIAAKIVKEEVLTVCMEVCFIPGYVDKFYARQREFLR